MPVEVKDNQEQILQCEYMLKRLVQTDSCQPEGNEASIVRFIEELIPPELNRTVISHSKERASLIVRIEGEQQGGLALIGHLDTVACNNPDSWKYPPHAGYVEDGVLYGRGASDMKGGITSMLLTLQKLVSDGRKPRKTIYFCFTADEESGGMGIISMVERGYLDTIEEVIICEPSGGRIGTCEKGALWLGVSIQGMSAHASRPELGLNAIEFAIAFAEMVKKYVTEAGEHPILGLPTVSITKLTGGIMTNIIPSDAQMELDIRTVPGVSHEKLLAFVHSARETMEKQHPGMSMIIRVLNNRPALECDSTHMFLQKIYNAGLTVGIDMLPKGLNFYTDASQLLPHMSIPFVIAGPGEDSAAHTVNESINLESVIRYSKFYSCYIEKYIM